VAGAQEDIRDSFLQARAAQGAYCDALTAFNVACVMGDDGAAERAREQVLACMESFMDHHAAAYRRMRDQQ
jgi:hypothetical protein